MNEADESVKYATPFTFRPRKKDEQILDSILNKNLFLGTNRSAAIRVALEEWEANNAKGPRCTRCKSELEEVSRGRWSCPICDPSRAE